MEARILQATLHSHCTCMLLPTVSDSLDKFITCCSTTPYCMPAGETWEQEMFNSVLSAMVLGGPVLGHTAIFGCSMQQDDPQVSWPRCTWLQRPSCS
jgi:hypothetical protein